MNAFAPLEGTRVPEPELSGTLQAVEGFRVVSAHLGAETQPPSLGPSALGADAPAVMERLGLDEEMVQAAIDSGALGWKSEEER